MTGQTWNFTAPLPPSALILILQPELSFSSNIIAAQSKSGATSLKPAKQAACTPWVRPNPFYRREAGWERSLHTPSAGMARARRQYIISSFPYVQTETINLKSGQKLFTLSYFEGLGHVPLTSAAQDEATQELKKSLRQHWSAPWSCPCSSMARVPWAAAIVATRAPLRLHMMERLCRIQIKMRK